MSMEDYVDLVDESTPTFREYETFGKGNYIIRICSFNVNCKINNNLPYDKWLFSEHFADIIVVGLQELYFKLKDVIVPESLFTNKINVEAHRRWINLFSNIKHMKDNYKLVISKSYGGLCLFIFIRKVRIKNQIQPVSNLMVGSFPLGMLGMANKGGLSISFRLDEISFCFINCHFPAGIENPNKRQQSMQTIIQKLQLLHSRNSKKINFIEAGFDLMFLFGDLNFRLQRTTSNDISKKLTTDKAFAIEKILQTDELIMLREEDSICRYFREGKIDFFPTYKFVVNSNNYNLKRVPSYCDRILWVGKRCVNISYSSHPELNFSDHRPISADFFIDGNIRSPRLSANFSKTNEYPVIKIVDTTIQFGDVFFLTNHFYDTKVENVGSISCEVTIKTLHAYSSMPTWFTIIPTSFVLEPQAFIVVHFRLFIDCDSLCNFNRNKENINCTIVCASVTNGSDTALRFQGKFHLSLFGIQLEFLQLIERPISMYTALEIEELEKSRFKMSTVASEPQFLLRRIMDLLMPNITITTKFSELILQHTGDMNDLLDLINTISSLDISTRASVTVETKYKIGTYIEAVLIFIKCLPHPIIPFVIQARLATNSKNRHHVLKVLHNLPRTNILFLRRIARFLSGFEQSKEEIEFISKFVVTCIPPSSPSLTETLVDVLSFLITKPKML